MRRRRLARLGGLEVSSNAPAAINGQEVTSPENNCSSGDTSIPTQPSNQPASPTKCKKLPPLFSPSLQNAEIPDTPMEVEDGFEKQSNTSGVDVDSGIENMEVEDADRKDATPRSRVRILIIFVKHFIDSM